MLQLERVEDSVTSELTPSSYVHTLAVRVRLAREACPPLHPALRTTSQRVRTSSQSKGWKRTATLAWLAQRPVKNM